MSPASSGASAISVRSCAQNRSPFIGVPSRAVREAVVVLKGAGETSHTL
jgi:hypothetical protein